MGPAQLQRLFRGIRYLNSRQANDNQTRRRAADAQSPLKFRITSQLRVFVHMLKESWAPTRSVATSCPRLWIRNIDDHSRARRHPASYGRTHLAQDSQDSTTSQERTDQPRSTSFMNHAFSEDGFLANLLAPLIFGPRYHTMIGAGTPTTTATRPNTVPPQP